MGQLKILLFYPVPILTHNTVSPFFISQSFTGNINPYQALRIARLGLLYKVYSAGSISFLFNPGTVTSRDLPQLSNLVAFTLIKNNVYGGKFSIPIAGPGPLKVSDVETLHPKISVEKFESSFMLKF